MSQHPGLFLVAFVCLGLAAFALWPSSAPAQHSGAPVAVYLGHPDMGEGSNGETMFEEAPDEEERSDSALPDESATFAI